MSVGVSFSSLMTTLTMRLSVSKVNGSRTSHSAWPTTHRSLRLKMVIYQVRICFFMKKSWFLNHQGNVNSQECGTITGGPCDGDELWGTGIYQTDNQEGCSCTGIRAQTAIFRIIYIKGKCASRCSLGWSVESWDKPITNWGEATKSG